MSGYAQHFLSGVGLQEKLLKAGILAELPDDTPASAEGFTHRIFLNGGDKTEWRPVLFYSPDKMAWESKWDTDDCPIMHASMALPNQALTYARFFDGAYDGSGYIRNGKVFAIKPKVPLCDTPHATLEAAITAMKGASLDVFVDEMVERYTSVVEAGDYDTIADRQVDIIDDYVVVLYGDEGLD